jgi:hypothetical protein
MRHVVAWKEAMLGVPGLAGRALFTEPPSGEASAESRPFGFRPWRDPAVGPNGPVSAYVGQERRIPRWEHEAVLEEVQARLDRNPDAMRLRRQRRQDDPPRTNRDAIEPCDSHGSVRLTALSAFGAIQFRMGHRNLKG